MTTQKDVVLQARLAERGIAIALAEALTLRRAQLTLHRWDESEWGNSSGSVSWVVCRDGTTGKPYLETYTQEGTTKRPIPDREAGAHRRVDAVCKANGLFWYHQPNCRGCALYVSKELLNSQNYYSTGVPCCVQ